MQIESLQVRVINDKRSWRPAMSLPGDNEGQNEGHFLLSMELRVA